MKKILFPIIALLALAACSKVTPVDMPDGQQEVSFEVANYVQTKADAPANGKYDTASQFGIYSWYITGDGNTVNPWMVNQKVGFANGVWKTIVNPYYWPKTGSGDFIAYSPFAGENGKAPAANQAQLASGTAALNVQGSGNATIPEPTITRIKAKDYTFEYPAYRVTADSPDLMYGDWANASSNVDQIKDGERDSGYKGVPTLFHHALAKVSVDIRATFLEYEAPVSKQTTTWKVTLQAAEIKNVKNTGSLKLTMGSDQKWVKPTGDVWSVDNQVAGESIVLYKLPEATPANDNTQTGQGQEATVPGLPLTTEYQNLLSERFVLPQALGDQQQTGVLLHLKFFINTYRPNEKDLTEVYEDTFLLSSSSKVDAWKMNQCIKYTIDFKPTAKVVPDKPDDPTDAELTFVPAVEGWTVVTDKFEIVL